MSELKPCPFCGAAPEWNWGQTGDGSPWRYLACSECQAMGPHVAEWELSKTAPDKDAVNDAIRSEAWNRRAALEGDAQPVAVDLTPEEQAAKDVQEVAETHRPAIEATVRQFAPSSDSLRKLEVAREALEKIACRHVTVNPLWWQLAARAALSQLEKPQDAGEMG